MLWWLVKKELRTKVKCEGRIIKLVEIKHVISLLHSVLLLLKKLLELFS